MLEQENNTSVSESQRKKSYPATQVVILKVPQEVVDHLGARGRLEDLAEVPFYNQKGGPFEWSNIPYEVREARMKKSDKEKKEARRLYTKEYTSRPLVKEKIQARLAKPETKKKRADYSQREDVKEKKREQAKRKRLISRMLKDQNPELYDALADDAMKKLHTEEAIMSQ